MLWLPNRMPQSLLRMPPPSPPGSCSRGPMPSTPRHLPTLLCPVHSPGPERSRWPPLSRRRTNRCCPPNSRACTFLRQPMYHAHSTADIIGHAARATPATAVAAPSEVMRPICRRSSRPHRSRRPCGVKYPTASRDPTWA
jgi:hypothetical protein